MSTLNYELKGNVAILTIQSPPANALSTLLLDDLSHQLDKIEENEHVKTIILKGDGRFFSAGADIKEFTDLQHASDYEMLSKKGQDLFNRIEQFQVPIIAAIHGAALGGGLELAMACHMRIVSEETLLGLPELTLGIIPGFAGTQRLPSFVGAAKAYEMILTGNPIKGRKAHSLGLANHCVATDEDVFIKATELANKIAEKSKPTVTKVMTLVPYAKQIEFVKGMEAEAAAFGQVFGSEDAKEGIEAFIEKRKPNFQDK